MVSTFCCPQFRLHLVLVAFGGGGMPAQKKHVGFCIDR